MPARCRFGGVFAHFAVPLSIHGLFRPSSRLRKNALSESLRLLSSFWSPRWERISHCLSNEILLPNLVFFRSLLGKEHDQRSSVRDRSRSTSLAAVGIFSVSVIVVWIFFPAPWDCVVDIRFSFRFANRIAFASCRVTAERTISQSTTHRSH
jgi:hypothetical protein